MFVVFGNQPPSFWMACGVGGEGDVLRFHVEIEGPVAAVAADAGILDAAEGRRQMADVLGIHPDHPGLEMRR